MAALFGVMCVAVGVANWRAVEAASGALVRGQADLLHDELRVSVGREQPSSQELSDVLSSYDDQRLVYLALFDREGSLLVEAGHSAWPPSHRAQAPAGVSIDRREGLVRARYRRGMPRRFARMGTPGTLLVFEFEPQSVNQLERSARRGVAVSVLFGLFAVGLALSSARQRRRAETAQRKEEQSRRLAALGQMSAVLAHELRNPLASLKGHAQLLERGLGEGAQRDKAHLVVSEALRLEQLTNDLLTFVKTGELHRAPTDLVALVREVIAGKDITLHAPQALTLDLDADRMRQVVTNLVDNAIAAGAPVEITVADRALTVRDHGAGIRDPARLFEPFYTTKARGTGLGLAISRQIVELHGGTLTARNVDGGAAFVMSLGDGKA
ncbi:MAG: HAMP domain-containing sensor histidine kinase [Polyangia bacterium]